MRPKCAKRAVGEAADDPAQRSPRRLGDWQIFARRRHGRGSKDVFVPAYSHDRAMHEPNLAATNRGDLIAREEQRMGRENHCGETPAAGALGEARLNWFPAGSLIAPITGHRPWCRGEGWKHGATPVWCSLTGHVAADAVTRPAQQPLGPPVSVRLPTTATSTGIPGACRRRSTVLAFRATRYALRDHSVSAAAVAPGHRRTAICRAAFVHALFQAATDRSNFLQQHVTKFNLRGQHLLRRTALGQ
jgi:hypothetical protein